jgi:hypothetical protein
MRVLQSITKEAWLFCKKEVMPKYMAMSEAEQLKEDAKGIEF